MLAPGFRPVVPVLRAARELALTQRTAQAALASEAAALRAALAATEAELAAERAAREALEDQLLRLHELALRDGA